MIRYCIFLLLVLFHHQLMSQNQNVVFNKAPGSVTLSSSGKSTSLYANENDYAGVIRAVRNLKTDIGLVTDVEPTLALDKTPSDKEVIVIGTIGKSSLIDQLIQNKKIDVSSLKGKWETFLIQVIEKPFPNVDRALVIAGSDKRGTIYGVYDLSKQIGVSPWYWWADVPPQKNKELFAQGSFNSGEPAVKYRGIFINDEEPSLGRFVVEKYGGFKHEFYEKVFELILRLKGNYLWPAMWWASFNSDDPMNPQLADEYGVVMGTSHHEPMVRAHAEWKTYGKGGEWNYETNTATLQKFWTEGIQRMGERESIITLAMRGDGDMAMTPETNTALLERIVKDQRKIIADVTGKDVTTLPQMWALYKEVQAYYDKGMRVPDDVTLLLCDDNWGNIRKLPNLSDKPRKGGYGIYYHFDYVGDPRNYKWVNTNPIIKVWEQMHLAYEHGVDRIWIVNVGDIKPMEFPISFFLEYAWNPKKWNQDNVHEFTKQWCEQQFGKTYASEIADIIRKYSKFNGRRKPELLTPETYSLVNYKEAEKIASEYRELEKQADNLYERIPPSQRDAFYQLVLHPVKACANLNDLYVTVGKNRLYATQGRAATNELAERAEKLYQTDSEISNYYNKSLAGGKWNNMMNQIHIGYTYWQDPKESVMPEVKRIETQTEAEMGVSVEGSEKSWQASSPEIVLPKFNSFQKSIHYFEIFNRGKTPFDFSISTNQPWLKVSLSKGTIEKEARVLVSVDWSKAPDGITPVQITVASGNKQIVITANVNKPSGNFNGFIETDHCISIEPEHFDRAVNTKEIKWQVLPDYGNTLSGVTPFPVTSPKQNPDKTSPHLEYDLYMFDTATVSVQFYLGTTLAFNANVGLQLGVSIDNEPPQIINIHQNETPKTWGKTVEDNMRLIVSKHKIKTPGKHILKYWMVDPGIVLQKIVINAGGAKQSYLGPPESAHITSSKK